MRTYQRLPNPNKWSQDSLEVFLGNWWPNQQKKLKLGQLQAHRLQRLQSTSVALIQQRVGKWLSGGREAIFKQRCQDLESYLETHNQQLPSYSSPDPKTRKLGNWLKNLRRGLPRSRVKEVNSFKALKQVLQLETYPVKIGETLWSRNLEELSTFIYQHRRLPAGYRTSRSENRLYQWLWRQRSRIRMGHLPKKFVAALRDEHPLISEAVAIAIAESNSLNAQ